MVVNIHVGFAFWFLTPGKRARRSKRFPDGKPLLRVFPENGRDYIID